MAKIWPIQISNTYLPREYMPYIEHNGEDEFDIRQKQLAIEQIKQILDRFSRYEAKEILDELKTEYS